MIFSNFIKLSGLVYNSTSSYSFEVYLCLLASERSKRAQSCSCSIEISDTYIYIYVAVRQVICACSIVHY